MATLKIYYKSYSNLFEKKTVHELKQAASNSLQNLKYGYTENPLIVYSIVY